jgi:hypothetical protein
MRQFHLLGSLCLAMSGCFSSSIHPILTDKDIIHDVDLSGTWRQIDVTEKQGPSYEFTLAGYDGNGRYDMTLLNFQEDERSRLERDQKGGKAIPAEYEVAIGKLGKHRFLQARRAELITGPVSFFDGVVTYTFAKFEPQDDVLLVYIVNDQALENLLPKTTMAHFMHKPTDPRNIVITESTPRVQEFLKQHHQTVFHSEPLKFRRLPAKSDEQSHPPEPAGGPESNGKSSSPAR